MDYQDDQEQRALSHAFLNTIHSSLQGRYTRMNAQQQLGINAIKQDKLADCGAQLMRVKEAFDRLCVGRIESLTKEPLSDGAQWIIQIHQELQQEIAACVPLLHSLLTQQHHNPTRETEVTLTVYLAGRAYAREHYVQGLVKFADAFGLSEQADQYRQHVLHTREEIRIASYFFQVLKEQELLTPEQRQLFFDETLLIAGLYASQKHDFTMNEIRRGAQPSYEAFNLSAEQASMWKQEGFTPADAAYWDAHDFSPADAGVWRQIGFANPAEAAAWQKRGFDATTASLMAMAGVRPQEAAQHAGATASSTDTPQC